MLNLIKRIMSWLAHQRFIKGHDYVDLTKVGDDFWKN